MVEAVVGVVGPLARHARRGGALRGRDDAHQVAGGVVPVGRGPSRRVGDRVPSCVRGAAGRLDNLGRGSALLVRGRHPRALAGGGRVVHRRIRGVGIRASGDPAVGVVLEGRPRLARTRQRAPGRERLVRQAGEDDAAQAVVLDVAPGVAVHAVALAGRRNRRLGAAEAVHARLRERGAAAHAHPRMVGGVRRLGGVAQRRSEWGLHAREPAKVVVRVRGRARLLRGPAHLRRGVHAAVPVDRHRHVRERRVRAAQHAPVVTNVVLCVPFLRPIVRLATLPSPSSANVVATPAAVRD